MNTTKDVLHQYMDHIYLYSGYIVCGVACVYLISD